MATPNHTNASLLSPHPSPSNNWGPYSSAKDFVANMAMVLVVLLCFIILGFALTTAIHCVLRRRRRLRQVVLPTATELQKPSRPPTANEEMLPSLVFSPGAMNLVDCAICLAEFVDGDRVSVLPACEHGFHTGCIKAWLSSSSSCPTCRRSCQATGEPSESLPEEP